MKINEITPYSAYGKLKWSTAEWFPINYLGKISVTKKLHINLCNSRIT